jgi:hypothetical protein
VNYDLDTKEGMANAVKWTEQMFNVLNDGASWGLPRSGTLVRVNKQTKTATITQGFAPEDGLAQVIRAMGWKVIVN